MKDGHAILSNKLYLQYFEDSSTADLCKTGVVVPVPLMVLCANQILG